MPSKPTVHMLDPYHPDATTHATKHFNIIPPTHANPTWHQTAQYLLVRDSNITATDISLAPHLVAISKQGVGLDKIDLQACAARGIAVYNTPGVNASAVAELVLGLALGVARRMGPILARQGEGEGVGRDGMVGVSLRGRTLGVVGLGCTGREVARLFKAAFGARVVVFRPRGGDLGVDEGYVLVRSLDELLEVADVVTLHVPLTEETRHMISYDQFRRMKKSAILINTARGGIVNEADLARALSEGLIFGAGLDVHEQEPPTREKYDQLWKSGNVVSLPHVGATTKEAQVETGKGAVDNLYEHMCRVQREGKH